MTLLYTILFLTPFHSDPRLGTVLLNAGIVVVTPLKILGLFAAAGAMLAPELQGAAPRLRSSLVGLFLVFVSVPVIATCAYGLPMPGRDISQLLSAAFLFIAIIPLVRTRDRMTKTVRALVLGFTFGALWVFKQRLHGELRPGGLEQDANYEALMLLLALPLAFWMARYEEGRWWRRIGSIASLALGGAVVLTESRGGMIAAGAMGLLAVRRSRHKLGWLSLLVIAAVLIFSFGPAGLDQRFESIKLSGRPQGSPGVAYGAELSSRIHFELLKAALRMIEAHPLVGVGLERFKAVAPEYSPEFLRPRNISGIAHNTYLQVGAEAGIPMLAVFLTMLAVAFRNCRLVRQVSDAGLSSLGLAIYISLAGICIAGFFVTSDFLPFAIVVALTQSIREIGTAALAESASDERPAGLSRVGAPRAFASGELRVKVWADHFHA